MALRKTWAQLELVSSIWWSRLHRESLPKSVIMLYLWLYRVKHLATRLPRHEGKNESLWTQCRMQIVLVSVQGNNNLSLLLLQEKQLCWDYAFKCKTRQKKLITSLKTCQSHTRHIVYGLFNTVCIVPTGSPSRDRDVAVYVFDISQPSLPTLFYSVLVSVSVLMVLSTVFSSINSPSVLLVFFLPCWSFQLYYLFMKAFLSPDTLLCGWLGLQHQITD